MLTGFTPQFQLWSTLAAAGLFSAAVYLTRARRRRVMGALAATLIFTELNILWDLAAHTTGWWSYPSYPHPTLPLLVYVAPGLVWGGAFALLGWRIQRRWGMRGAASFVLVLSVLGGWRDFEIAFLTGAITFGNGYAPPVADFTCWLTLLISAQTTLRLIAGPSTYDGLARA